MKITREYLKQLITEELKSIKGGGEGSGKATGKLSAIGSQPSIKHITDGALQPLAKPEFVDDVGDYYIYKFGYGFGDRKVRQQHNFYGVFLKSNILDRTLQEPRPVDKYEINQFGDEKAKQMAIDYASEKKQPPSSPIKRGKQWKREKTYGGG